MLTSITHSAAPPACTNDSAPVSKLLDRKASDRRRVAKWRKSNPRYDYAAAGDVLRIIAERMAARPGVCKAVLLDELIRAGYRALTGNGATHG